MTRTAPFFSIMGIVNVTPDSFSDGGRYLAADAAVEHALRLAAEGADLIDLGAESTRPGAQPVSCDEEWQRLAPVLTRLRPRLPRHCRVSVDTRHPLTMRRALDAGVLIINNIAGRTERGVLELIASDPSLRYIAMHMHGTPATMQQTPLNGAQAVADVERYFADVYLELREAGLSHTQIYLDPGIGFGKTDRANLLLMAHTPVLARSYQLLLGVSRKAWLGRLLDLAHPADRDPPSKIAEFTLALAGAKIIRTHDVKSLGLLRNVFTSTEL